MTASRAPLKSIKRATTIYMIPIFFGSVAVSHSLQSHVHRLVYVSTAPAATAITMSVPVPPMVYHTCGNEFQVNFPNKRFVIFTYSSYSYLKYCFLEPCISV